MTFLTHAYLILVLFIRRRSYMYWLGKVLKFVIKHKVGSKNNCYGNQWTKHGTTVVYSVKN